MAQFKQAAADIDYVKRAREATPAILAAAAQIEVGREIPDSLYAQLQNAGLYRLLIPQSLNGAELDPQAFVEVIETIAKADASTAWCIAQTAVCSMAAAYVDPQVAREIFTKNPRGVLAWGPPSRDAKAVAAPGGFRVTGKWMFASGSRQATWLAGHALLCNADGTLRTTPQGQPIERSMLFPRSSATLADVWDVVGLRGTGSDNYAVTDVFVPESHSFLRDGVDDRRHSGPLYRMSMFHMFAAAFAGVALGVAQASLDAFIQLAGQKTPMLGKSVLRDSASIQSQVGYCQTRLLSVRAFLYQSIGELWGGALRSDITLQQRAAMRMASTYAI